MQVTSEVDQSRSNGHAHEGCAQSASSDTQGQTATALRSTGKRTAYDYYIRIAPQYADEMLAGFRREGAAQFFRQYTDELWSPPFSRLTCAEYGAFRRLMAMFARSKAGLAENLIIVTAKELKMFGITLRILQQICAKLDQIEISCVTESGELKDLHGN